MKSPRALYVLSLVVFGTALSPAPADAFYFYRANEIARVDHCYRSPAWDYSGVYYTSRRYYRGKCRGYCCRK
jgi:hypothetical protein